MDNNQNNIVIPGKSMSIASLVCGILSCCIIFVGFAPAVVAIVLGAVARTKPLTQSVEDTKVRQFATAGFVLGIIGLVMNIVVVVFW